MAGRRNLLLLGGIGAAVGSYLVLGPHATPNGNVFETHGVKNVGDAFTSAGGAGSHQPAIATRRGGDLSKDSPAGNRGIGSEHFDDKHGEQSAVKPGYVKSAFNSGIQGSDKGRT